VRCRVCHSCQRAGLLRGGQLPGLNRSGQLPVQFRTERDGSGPCFPDSAVVEGLDTPDGSAGLNAGAGFDFRSQLMGNAAQPPPAKGVQPALGVP